MRDLSCCNSHDYKIDAEHELPNITMQLCSQVNWIIISFSQIKFLSPPFFETAGDKNEITKNKRSWVLEKYNQ